MVTGGMSVGTAEPDFAAVPPGVPVGATMKQSYRDVVLRLMGSSMESTIPSNPSW